MRSKALSAACFICGVAVVVATIDLSSNRLLRAHSEEEFVCNSGCDCVGPKSSTVLCKSGARCETISDFVDCAEYNEFLGGGRNAISEINGGKKPDGCKDIKAQNNCDEESFECWRYTYCTLGMGGTCMTDPINQGPAQQETRKKLLVCQ